MAREDPQLKLRLPEELKTRIADAARENGRSVNAEIVARLSGNELSEERFALAADLWRVSNEIRDLSLKETRARIEAYKTGGEIADKLRAIKNGGDPFALADEIIGLLRELADNREEIDEMIDGITSQMVALAKALSPPVPEKF